MGEYPAEGGESPEQVNLQEMKTNAFVFPSKSFASNNEHGSMYQCVDTVSFS